MAVLLLPLASFVGLQSATRVAAAHWEYQAAVWAPFGWYNCSGESISASKPQPVLVHSCATGASGVVYVASKTWALYSLYEGNADTNASSVPQFSIDIAEEKLNSYGGIFDNVSTVLRLEVYDPSAIHIPSSSPFGKDAQYAFNASDDITPPAAVANAAESACGPVNFGYEGPHGPSCSPAPCSPGKEYWTAPVAMVEVTLYEGQQRVQVEMPAVQNMRTSGLLLRVTSTDACYQTMGGMAPTTCSTKPGGLVGESSCGFGDISRGPFCVNGSHSCSPYVPTKLAHLSVKIASNITLDW